MIRESANKARAVPMKGAAAGEKCPRCGKRDRHCREVPMGHWCARDGLLEAPGRVVAPSNPRRDAIQADPDVKATAAAWGEATAAAEAAREAYSKAVLARHDHDLATTQLAHAAATGNGMGRSVVLIGATRDRLQRDNTGRRLVAAEDSAEEALNTARAQQQRAAVAHRRATAAAAARYEAKGGELNLTRGVASSIRTDMEENSAGAGVGCGKCRWSEP